MFDDGSEFDYRIYHDVNGEKQNIQYAIVYLETRDSMWVAKVKGFINNANGWDALIGAGALFGPKWISFASTAFIGGKAIVQDPKGTNDRRIMFIPITAVPSLCEQVVNM